MDLIAINLARASYFLELVELDPKGRNTTGEGISGLGTRYSFTKVPKTVEELDFQKGAAFVNGRFEDVAIEQILLFHNGIAIDTRSSTDDSLRVLHDMLEYAKNVYGAKISPARRFFTSQITFQSELKLQLLNPMLQPIADRLAAATSKDLSSAIVFEPTAILIGAETWQTKVVPSAFSIERRTDAPFKENTYYSSAPLSTTEHLKLVAEIEDVLR